MAITLYQDRNLHDRPMIVTRSISDLQDVSIGKNPSSLRMTEATESILLYTHKDWDGDVHYIRGPREVDDLGSKDSGGEAGFRNSVRSVRVTPFHLRLNVNVIRDEAGENPGQWAVGTEQSVVRDIVDAVNSFYAAQRALLALEIARVNIRISNAKYNLRLTDEFRFPNDWRNPHEIDVMIVNQFEKDGVLGVAKFPHFGRTVMVAASYIDGAGTQQQMDADDMAEVMAHELGHYLGLQHITAGGAPANLMYKDTALGGLSGRNLEPDQVEEMQQKLARAIARGGDRHN